MENDLEKQQVIQDFENLVDELLKSEPDEILVRQFMEKLDMKYETDSVNRIGAVLEKMNHLIFDKNHKKGQYDLQ